MQAEGCIDWPGRRSPNGYGRVGHHYVHRVVAQMILGRSLAREEQVCHRCDRPICFSPAHLVVADAKWNSRDCVAKGRLNPRPGAMSRSKLTDESRRAILTLYSTGNYTHRHLGRVFGVDHSIVGDVVRRAGANAFPRGRRRRNPDPSAPPF